jgi:hypothetical protein
MVSITNNTRHTKFPALEIYANRQLIYFYDPVAELANPFDLLGGYVQFLELYPVRPPVQISPIDTKKQTSPVCAPEPTFPKP